MVEYMCRSTPERLHINPPFVSFIVHAYFAICIMWLMFSVDSQSMLIAHESEVGCVPHEPEYSDSEISKKADKWMTEHHGNEIIKGSPSIQYQVQSARVHEAKISFVNLLTISDSPTLHLLMCQLFYTQNPWISSISTKLHVLHFTFIVKHL